VLDRLRAALRPPASIARTTTPTTTTESSKAAPAAAPETSSVQPALSANDKLSLKLIRELIRIPDRLGAAADLVLSFEKRLPGCNELKDIAGDLVVACCSRIKAADQEGAKLLGWVGRCAAIIPGRPDVVRAMDETVYVIAPRVTHEQPELLANTLIVTAKLLTFTPSLPKLHAIAISLVEKALTPGQQPAAALLLSCEAVLGALPDSPRKSSIAHTIAQALLASANTAKDATEACRCLTAASNLNDPADQELDKRLGESFFALGTRDDERFDAAARLHCFEGAACRADDEDRSRILPALLKAVPTNEIDGEGNTDLRNRIAVLSYCLDPPGDKAAMAPEDRYPDWLTLRREALDKAWNQKVSDLQVLGRRADLIVIHLPRPLANLSSGIAGIYPEPSDWPELRRLLETSGYQ